MKCVRYAAGGWVKVREAGRVIRLLRKNINV